MALKPQSIRKGVTILNEGTVIEKQTIISASESWTEQQESFFKKMLKQGGKCKINGVSYEIRTPEGILTSRGEKDPGIITLPGLDSRF